jgi:hypothetical protein
LVVNAPTEPALPGEFTTKPAVPAGFDRGFRRGIPIRRSKVRFAVESCRSLVPADPKTNARNTLVFLLVEIFYAKF